MNDLYLAKWPDGSITLISASSVGDLILRLDSEGNPECCVVRKIVADDTDNILINFNVKNKNVEIEPNLDWELCGGKLKKIKIK